MYLKLEWLLEAALGLQLCVLCVVRGGRDGDSGTIGRPPGMVPGLVICLQAPRPASLKPRPVRRKQVRASSIPSSSPVHSRGHTQINDCSGLSHRDAFMLHSAVWLPHKDSFSGALFGSLQNGLVRGLCNCNHKQITLGKRPGPPAAIKEICQDCFRLFYIRFLIK